MMFFVKKINSRSKIFLLLMFYFIIIGIVIYFIIIPSLKYINSTGENIIYQRVEEDKFYKSIKTTKDLEKKLNVVDYKMKEVDSYFIRRNEDLDFIKKLEDLASKNNIVQNISIDTDFKNGDDLYKKVPLQLSLSGKFKDITNYISEFEALNYYINIKSIDIVKSTNENEAISIDSNFNTGTLAPKSKGGITCIISADSYWK